MAFADIIPTLQNREMEVLRAIKKIQPCNNLMIANYLHLPVNCITGRIFSLRELGIVIYYKKGKCPYTNKTTIFWKIVDRLNQVII